MARVDACGICGRRGRRDCPSLKGQICTACCGAGRGSTVDCPAHCPHFPFGTEAYGQWLKIDETWFTKALGYVVDSLSRRRFEELTERLSTATEMESEIEFEAGVVHAVHYSLAAQTDEAGRTLGDRWEEQQWEGLNNDERVMTLYRRHTWPGIIEVQKILHDHGTLCIDVLDPGHGSFLLFDRSIAGQALRFSRYLVWITHYPHFSRVAGVGTEVPSHVHEEFLHHLRKKARTKKTRYPLEPVKRHLAENFADCCDLLADLCREFKERLIRSVDAHHCRAWYRLKAEREEIEQVLREKPDFELDEAYELDADDPPGTACYMWLRRGEAKAFEKNMPAVFRHDDEAEGVGTLGTLRLTDTGLVVEAFGRKKFDFAKSLVSRYFGRHLKLKDQKIVDLTEEVLSREDRGAVEPEEDRHPEIPAGVRQEIFEQFHRRQYEKFLDDTIPMLGGLTPRQAAADPNTRPRLIELMKIHLHGLEKRSREEGIGLDIDWVVDELGLHELQ